MSTEGENGPAEVVPSVHYPSDELFHLGNCVMKIRMVEQPDLDYWTGNGRKPKQCHRLHLGLFTALPYYWDKVIVRRRDAPESHICDLYARVNIMFKKNVDCYGNKVPWIVDRPTEHSAFERLDWTLDTSTGRLVDDYEGFIRNVKLSRLGCFNGAVELGQDLVLLRVRYTRATLRAIVMLKVLFVRKRKRKNIAMLVATNVSYIPASFVVDFVWGPGAFKPSMVREFFNET